MAQVLFYILGGLLIVLAVVLAVALAVALGIGATAVAALVGTVRVLLEFLRSAVGVLGANAPIEHLDGYAPPEPIKHLDDRAPAEPVEPVPDRDPGYRSYLFGPVLQDLREMLLSATDGSWSRTLSTSDDESLLRQVYESWGNGSGAAGGGASGVQLFLAPALVGAALGAVAGFVAGAVLALSVLAVFALFLAITAAAAALGTALLRGLETVMLRLRGITVECGNCQRRVSSPAYDCDGCTSSPRARHHRLVPGRLGVLWRTCRCGNRLPTLLLLGKSKLPAYCQHNHPLPALGLTTPTFHVPVVAGPSAGKTVFMLATVADLEDAAGPDGVEFAENSQGTEVRRMLTFVRDGNVDGVKKTLPELPLRALTIYHGAAGSRRRRLLYLYDAAGENYGASERIDMLRFLEFTAGVVFVVDPFALAAVRRAVGKAALDGARPSESDPTLTAERFTADLRARLAISTGRRLGIAAALVVTKCDVLLADGSVRHPYELLAPEAIDRDRRSTAVRDWLDEFGAQSIVNHLDAGYSRTSFFAVSALDLSDGAVRMSARTAAEVRNDAPAAALRWLLDPGREVQ